MGLLLTFACAAVVAAAYLAPHGLKRLAVRRLRSLCVRHRALALTFDDGPSPELTRDVLALLDEHRARATFFSLGMRAQRFPALLDEIASRGHEIGSHTQSHLHAWKCSPFRAVADIRAGFQTLAPWLERHAPFRPPYGKLTLPAAWALWRRGVRVAWWTVDSCDTNDRLPTPEFAAGRVRQEGGGVVLLHDFDRESPDRAARHAFVLDATRALLELARSEGLRICTFSELLSLSYGNPVEAPCPAAR